MVCDIDFIVITGNILRSVKNIPIIKPGILLYFTEDHYAGVLPHTFYNTITIVGQMNVDHYTRNLYH